jgi:CheY-like chemotaxis protein
VVEAVRSGTQGIRMLKERDFDLVVLDLMLPRLDGMEVCRRTRSDRKGGHVAVRKSDGRLILLVNDDNELEMKLAVQYGEKVQVPRVPLGDEVDPPADRRRLEDRALGAALAAVLAAVPTASAQDPSADTPLVRMRDGHLIGDERRPLASVGG